MTSTTVLLVDFLLGYALGSIPFGLLLTKYAGLGDVRKIGSGNIGATNVLRTGNKGLAAATLACDLLKGTVAVLIASRFVSHEWPVTTGLGSVLAGVGAVMSHTTHPPLAWNSMLSSDVCVLMTRAVEASTQCIKYK